MFGKVLDALRSNHERVLGNKFAQCCQLQNSIDCQNVSGPYCNLGETFLMRSKLAFSALVVASLFGSTLIASAQSQPAPGASSEGNVGPGATSGKKTKHEKGMTTGSTTRSGAKKGDAANPLDQDNAGSGADTMAAPKTGRKY